MLLDLTDLVLEKIGEKLSGKELLTLTMTSQALREFFRKETYWQKLMAKKMWIDRRFFHYQDDLLFILNNTPNRLCFSEQYEKIVRYVTYSHDGSMLAMIANGCQLWIFRGDEELLSVRLNKDRGWNQILHVEFSPDDEHVLAIGSKEQMIAMARGNQALIYQIKEDHVTLRSFVNLSSHNLGTWFDNMHIMYMNNENIQPRMRLYISSIDMTADVLVYPVLTFDTRITKILVAQHVSPRTRKITQIADQAQMEGKTLTQMLIEIGIEAGVDVNNMAQLREILDQENQCMPCYRLHSHQDAVSPRECQCQCHHNTDKLLIFHGVDDRVHVKVITEAILERAREAWRHRGEMEEDLDQNRLHFPLIYCTTFDTTDHVFGIGFSLLKSSMCLSPDNRYLYITGTRSAPPPNNPIMQIKPTCLDLETMVIKNLPDFDIRNWVEYEFVARITANNDFVAIFSGQEVIIWSAFHRGAPVNKIPHFNGLVSSVALHPLKNELLVTNERLMHYYWSPVMMREDVEIEQNGECSSSG